MKTGIAAAVIFFIVASTGFAHADNDGISGLVTKLKSDGAYSDLGCLSFDNDPADVGAIEVREIHGGKCPGDPAISPIRDRFRIRSGQSPVTYEWYDVIEDEWKPYDAFLQGRGR